MQYACQHSILPVPDAAQSFQWECENLSSRCVASCKQPLTWMVAWSRIAVGCTRSTAWLGVGKAAQAGRSTGTPLVALARGAEGKLNPPAAICMELRVAGCTGCAAPRNLLRPRGPKATGGRGGRPCGSCLVKVHSSESQLAHRGNT